MKPINKWFSWSIEGEEGYARQPSPMHCLLLVGYDENCYYFNDPLEKKSIAYPKDAVEAAYKQLGRQAIAIY